ncbi:DUF4241 domain-containing protein [Steroidobacter cummioxidans]|uniref:DUF4241 domain-containing protein n=1 Tax=Steroidobacter cummioxidans TaxID=1803913 RepID=UPI00137B460C|nr:DUF4241 domain-containing protein [Steroidobacter cummioxidans]
MLRRIVALVGSILGVPASSHGAQIDSSEQTYTIERAPLQPEARVRAFIADYHRAHSLLGTKEVKEQFERWERLVEKLDEAHFLDHEGRELAGVIHGKSPHTLAGEPIVSVKRIADRVFVETRLEEKYLTRFFEYELCEVDVGNWKILRLREFLDPADAPFMTEREMPRFEHPQVHPLQRLSAEDADFDGNRIFASGKSVELDGKVSSIDVREVGFLNVTTGVLVVGDFGYSPRVLSPVGQRVPPGRYLTEVAVAFERNAALRVRFSEHRVVAWHPADMGDGGHGVGVDAGNVAVMDLAALMTLKSRDKERAFEVYARADQCPNSMMLTLIQPNDTTIADSGWGDGRYPAYWGVDANGKPAVLVVDFLLLPRS